MMNNRTLAIFAKWPHPGAVKSRLAASTTPQWAAEVAMAFCVDTLRRFQEVCARRVVVFAPSEAQQRFAEIAGSAYQLMYQGEGNLGERLERFVQMEFLAASRCVVLLGTDSPTLPVSFVDEAFANLAHSDVVLGPATDGGYYLIGLSRFVPELFRAIEWGTQCVLLQTTQRIVDANLRLSLLSPWYDVDTLQDWAMVCGHIAALRQAGFDPGTPATERIINGS